MKSKQRKYEEAVERNLDHSKRRQAGVVNGLPQRSKFKSMEEAKRVVGARERDTQFDEQIRQLVEA